MGNNFDCCTKRSEKKEKMNNETVYCSMCQKKYHSKFFISPICNNCKILENEYSYDFKPTTLLIDEDYYEGDHDWNLGGETM